MKKFVKKQKFDRIFFSSVRKYFSAWKNIKSAKLYEKLSEIIFFQQKPFSEFQMDFYRFQWILMEQMEHNRVPKVLYCFYGLENIIKAISSIKSSGISPMLKVRRASLCVCIW